MKKTILVMEVSVEFEYENGQRYANLEKVYSEWTKEGIQCEFTGETIIVFEPSGDTRAFGMVDGTVVRCLA